MKILIVCPDWFPFSSGLAQSCYELCTRLEQNGHEVRVIVAKDKNVDHKGLKVIEIPYITRLLGRNPIVWNLYGKIRKQIKWCDTVCLFSYMYEMNSRMVILQKLGFFNKPIIHFYRGSLEQESVKHLSFATRIAKNIYDATFARILFKNVDHTISNSNPTLKIIQKKYGVSKRKLSYVKNSVDTSQFKVSKLNNKRVLFVGRLIENKGIKYFPEIVKVIPLDWKFTIVDAGPLMPRVKELKKKYPNIEIKGKISHKSLIDLYSKSDILVLPTLAEGSPRAVMEASASGVPSICFGVGDVPNTIPMGTGFSIKPFDISDFTHRLHELITDDKKRKKFGKNAKTFAKKELEWETNYRKIEEILMNVTKKYRP